MIINKKFKLAGGEHYEYIDTYCIDVSEKSKEYKSVVSI